MHNDGVSSNVEDALIRLNKNVSNNRSLIDSNTNSINTLNTNFENCLTLTYIGDGIESGQNEREPYFDFTNLSNGLYLVANSDRNIPNRTFAAVIFVTKWGAGINYTKCYNNEHLGDIFTNDRFILKGKSMS